MRDDIEYGYKDFSNPNRIVSYFNDVDNDDKEIISVVRRNTVDNEQRYVVFYKIEKNSFTERI